MVLGLGVGQLALAPHLLDQRVVPGQLLQLAAAQPVGAAVAYVADRHLFTAVERDAERKFVGQAAVEGDAAGVVGAEEPDLAVAVPGAEGDRPDQSQAARALLPCATDGAAACGELLAATPRGRGRGPAAHLGPGQASLLRAPVRATSRCS